MTAASVGSVGHCVLYRENPFLTSHNTLQDDVTTDSLESMRSGHFRRLTTFVTTHVNHWILVQALAPLFRIMIYHRLYTVIISTNGSKQRQHEPVNLTTVIIQRAVYQEIIKEIFFVFVLFFCFVQIARACSKNIILKHINSILDL